MSSEPLQVAYRLIREGNKQEAIRILTPIVRADPANADAWWLLANAVDNPEQKRRALERVLRLRPEDERAQRMYNSLQGSPQPRPAAAPPPQTRTAYPPADEFSVGGDYHIDDSLDPFAAPQPQQVRVTKSRGGGCGPCGIIFGIFALLVVFACGLCIVGLVAAPAAISGVAVNIPGFSEAFAEVMQTVTRMPEYPTIEAALTQIPGIPSMLETLGAEAGTSVNNGLGIISGGTPVPQNLPTNTNKRGAVQLGETVTGTVDTFVDDSWTFSGTAGTTITIVLNATDGTLDPQLELYNPGGIMIAENDDTDGSNNRNSRIQITLPETGLYTIIVSAFGTGGTYELIVS